jgi:small-conductance mechanosensitive channel
MAESIKEHMNEWADLYQEIRVVGTTELGRIAATLLIAAVTTLGMKLVQKRARLVSGMRLASGATLDIGRHRRNFVMVKNLILITAVVIVSTIWASKIAGAALSLAAVAGATLIVCKEFLANLLGGLMLAISKPYRIGDFIQLEGISGRVVDSDMLVTTIAETMESHQLTGRTVSLPHSLLLVRPVRNLTATGDFMINIMTIAVHPNEDLLAQESALLKAAGIVCAPWMAEANEHLRRVSSRELVDLPTAEPKVLIQLNKAEEYTLALRYCCMPNDRVKVEQSMTRIYIRTRTPFHVPGAIG